MTKLARATLLVVAAILGFSPQQVRGGAVPAVTDNSTNSFTQFQNQRSETGPDGNNRFIWDYSLLPAIAPAPYFGSVLWIIDPTGNFVAAGNVAIPKSVGSDNSKFLPGSHIALHVSADNNTTLAFAFLDSTNAFVQSFATWTFNAQGILIASAGPFSFTGLGLQNIEFQRDFLVVRWVASGALIPRGPTAQFISSPVSVWVLDEFGTIVSAAGPFGPFGNTSLGQVTLTPSSSGPPNQLWHWLFTNDPVTETKFGVRTWTINPSGVVIAATSFGPF